MGRDPITRTFSTCSAGFNPRARMGRDVKADKESVDNTRFQSTRPHGARLTGSCNDDEVIYVSIHAPAWGATDRRCRAAVGEGVSIHAPAWGATRAVRRTGPGGRVSIHAPAWGATHRGRSVHHPNPCFNPRARMGRDLSRRGSPLSFSVSIHAPAWGATKKVEGPAHPGDVSIHAPAWGATGGSSYIETQISFQSTRPHGARLQMLRQSS